MMEFHISRNARERYQFVESLFSYSGNVVFANVAACREFAYRMNKVRDVEKHPEQSVHAGKLYAMGLIDEASHLLIARYREQFDSTVMTRALEWFSGQVGAEALGRMLLTFVEEFPGATVMRGQMTPWQWLMGQTEGTSHWAVALEELLLLWTANRNEAFQPFEELFEEKTLAERTVYRQVTEQFPKYFATRPLIPVPEAKPMSLLELLRAPAAGAPRSLADQLALIRKLWKPLIGESLERHLVVAGEILHEEELAIWMQFNPPSATAEAAAKHRRETGQQEWPSVAATAEVPVFGDLSHEYEGFSPDGAWMPTAVLLAKSTYVWLAQMSKHYGRAITKLDEIPDGELATLARRGINSLWLIGVWERSRASKTIKVLCGNTDAVASAYSLYDYRIAEDLGGEAAYTNLRDRAYRHGIRLASDMVPNHMGIDSPWVIEHPEWFMSRPDAPYPAYSYNGPDLSRDVRVEIKIEDHYYEQSDAAVVFRRRDRASGETRYIYHGNDGTSFPWNDTAQLDYLNPAVREQVIQTILKVARLFPVIRFDAAMTLAKRHFHRLWFPSLGASGAIPSRAEYGMSQAEFNQQMPHEFWREVVDRVAAEVPGTLLLAEAFWLMEGYFVRTLGMHRVYNSAFMVMLRDEENAKYRSVIKNTLEFDPDIMKRYVNFMSNPDERTAIDQFGKGDKCFGVAAMMATLPGLPMFGHGQIEGFTEKYGMEYQRPRYDETPDPWLVERHEREIAPLLQRRRLFAESGNFLLYDFYLDSGTVDENVFAYSNRNGDERALVVYNNRYGHTRGTIDHSAAYADKASGQLRQQRIGEGLGLSESPEAILAWRDSFTGLEYLRRASELSERGLTLELRAYQCHVFLDWRELHATAEQPWDRLCDQLNGRGVANLEDALANLELQPVHDALCAQLDSGMVRLFADLAEHPRLAGTLAVGINTEIEAERKKFFDEAWARCENFLRVAQEAYLARVEGEAVRAQAVNPALLSTAFRQRLRAAMRIPAVEALFPAPWTVAARSILPSPSPQLTATAMWGPVLGWCALELLAESIDAQNAERIALDLFDRLRLRQPFAQAFSALGFEGEEGWRVAARIKVVLLTGAGAGKPQDEAAEAAPGMVAPPEPAAELEERVALPPALWSDPDVRWLSGVHRAEGHDYLVRERYEELLWWLLMPSLLRLAGEAAPSRRAVQAMSRSIEEALATAEAAGYRVDLLLAPAVAEAENGEAASEAGGGAEADAESAAEPEAFAEARPLPVEPEPDEPESEPAAEVTAEAVIGPEAPAEAQTLPEEPGEPTPPESEPGAELPAEAVVEPETPTEARSLPFKPEKLGEPVEPESEPATEVAGEPVAEAEAPAVSQPLLAEGRELAEPKSKPADEVPAEAVVESETPTEEQPLPVEPEKLGEPDEPESEPATEVAGEPVAEAEEPTISQPLPAEGRELAEPKSKPADEVPAEAVVEPETRAEARPLPVEPEKPAEPESEPAAVPETPPELRPWLSEDREPPEPEIKLVAKPVDKLDKPVAEPKAVVGLPPSLIRPWEPAAPKIDFAVNPAAEPRAVAESLPSLTHPWEPPAPKIEFTAKPAAKPKEVAESLPSLTHPWEPPAQKIEFTAKPVTEAKAEPEGAAEASSLPSQPWKPARPEIE
jgi:glycosidase